MNHLETSPLSLTLTQLRASFWLRRVLQGLVHTAWLTMLVPVGLMAAYLGLGVQVRWQVWVLLMGLVGSGFLLWAMRPITLKEMVQRLEGSLELRAQLVTAFEANQSYEADNQVVQLLLQQTAAMTARLRRRVHIFNMSLWLEIQALIAVSALFSAMLMLEAFNPRLPNAAPVDLPAAWQEPKADQLPSANPELPPKPSPNLGAQQDIQRILEILANAFRDQAMTHAIAGSIDQHQLREAATGLRRLADQLESLTAESRQGLANAMLEAARKIGQNEMDFTEPLQTGGTALERGNLRKAGQSLEALAKVLDSLDNRDSSPQPNADGNSDEQANEPKQVEQEQSGQAEQKNASADQQPPPEENLANQSESPAPQPTENERLGVAGQPLELENKEDFTLEEHVLQPSELTAEGGDKRTQDSPFARPSGENEDLGSDPLTYPWEKREVIRQYFSN